MTDDLIERAARAIDPSAWEVEVVREDGSRASAIPAWSPELDERRKVAVSKARAVIAALREPSGAMLEAGEVAISFEEGIWFTGHVRAASWRAMIDKLLEQKP